MSLTQTFDVRSTRHAPSSLNAKNKRTQSEAGKYTTSPYSVAGRSLAASSIYDTSAPNFLRLSGGELTPRRLSGLPPNFEGPLFVEIGFPWISDAVVTAGALLPLRLFQKNSLYHRSSSFPLSDHYSTMEFAWNNADRRHDLDLDREDIHMDGLSDGGLQSGDNKDAGLVRPLPFEELAQAPFDVGQVPDYQHVDDSIPQHEVLAAIQRETHSDRDYAAAFNSMPTRARRLSSFKNYAEQGRAGHAIALLRDRSRIIVDEEYLLHRHDANVIPHVKEHFIDFVLYMGNRIGLDALLPPLQVLVNHIFHVTWTFAQRNKLWPDSVGVNLSFSTTGRMIYLGRRFQEEFWIAFPPRGLLEDVDELPDMAPLDAPSSALTSRNQN
ncbi:hypothetical protein HYDPIDRAFT_171645, partial [Hydnomerulius pinastri MD-312]